MFSSRYGRSTKTPYYQKDYLPGDLENGQMETDSDRAYLTRRGRPSGMFVI